MIQNAPVKSRDKATTKCCICGEISNRTLVEHKRLCKRQSKYVSRFHCKSCLNKSESYQNKVKYVRGDAWSKKCSERAKIAWDALSEEDKKIRIDNARKATRSDKVRDKISKGVKAKFEDPEYRDKIHNARLRYWKNTGYRDNHTLSVNEFKRRASLIHGNKYDYSLVKFDGAARDSKVKIICPEHGVFYQRALWHTIYANGCPKCKAIVSKPHQYIVDMIGRFYSGQIIINDRDSIGFELDILMPDINFAVEYHGNYYHSHNESSHLSKYLHYLKSSKSRDVGIDLFQIFQYHWDSKQHIVESMIKHKLGLANKIGARQCKVVKLNTDQYRTFINSNHLYGYRHANICLGLVFEGRIVACMSFGLSGDTWEVIRLAFECGLRITGGSERLFKAFVREANPKSVISYYDRAISSDYDDCVYHRLGFNMIDITKPNYKYFKNNMIFSRFSFQKHKLSGKLPKFDPQKTELQNMFDNGYRVIWDAGHCKFLKEFN